VEGSLNTSQQKFRCGIKASYGGKDYGGDVYIDGNRIILTRDLFWAIQSTNPMLFNADTAELNEYLYKNDNELGELWRALKEADPGKILPVYRDMGLFLLEAVPDKYFTYSGGDVVFSLDQGGLEEVIYCMLTKIAAEPDRFNGLLADLTAAAGTPRDSDLLKKQLTAGGGHVPTAGMEEIKELLSFLTIERFVVKISPDVAGPIVFSAAMKINADKFSGRLDIDSTTSGSRASEIKSDYTLDLSMGGDKQGGFDLSWKGEGSQTGGIMKEKDILTFNLQDSGGKGLLHAVVHLNADIREDAGAQVDIPVLTVANSTDLDKLEIATKTPAAETGTPVSVFLDGKPVSFDVAPYIKDGRVMVPVRSLAEALGFQVGWEDPDRVIMTRDGRKVVMMVGQRVYTVDGESKQMDSSPFMINGRNIVPLRFVAQELGCRVEYSESENRVYIERAE
jgi:hypothetical protein